VGRGTTTTTTTTSTTSSTAVGMRGSLGVVVHAVVVLIVVSVRTAFGERVQGIVGLANPWQRNQRTPPQKKKKVSPPLRLPRCLGINRTTHSSMLHCDDGISDSHRCCSGSRCSTWRRGRTVCASGGTADTHSARRCRTRPLRTLHPPRTPPAVMRMVMDEDGDG